ncbi:hypothetical protein I552_8026 [Mycobacterium xenopi 3993]|nr:hypothetical protein I552_8026 [Mycobacterium xenopi 3993]
MQWIPRLELVETVAHIDPANIPLKPRPPYQLVCDPGIKNCDQLYRFAL